MTHRLMNKKHSEQLMEKKPKKKGFLYKFLYLVFTIFIIASFIVGYYIYSSVFEPNVKTPKNQNYSLFIKTNASFADVRNQLFDNGLILNKESFDWLANQKKYSQKIKPGHYVIKNGMSNQSLINLLRSGAQTPIKLTFNNVRDIFQLAGRISKQIEADSASIVVLLTDKQYISKLGFGNETISAMFLPNTYEFYWTTNADGFVTRMSKEYKIFWNESRKKQAKEIQLSLVEVSTLASIIDRETAMNSEKPAIAGVYINRLKSNWLLQADPTLIFALNDYSIQRVLDVHKEVDSKYNTYKYTGLPPGPICIPTISAIDAVLNYQKHAYFYFCAKDDFSGSHAFARTYAEHLVNARRFQQALNKQKIFR
jgi:UPF0755 protein